MANITSVPVEDMYSAWVASNRNSVQAARRLGIPTRNMQYHAKRNDFPGRYAREFNSTAEGIRKMVYTDMLMQMPVVMNELVRLITASDEEIGVIAKIAAIKTFLTHLPPPQDAPDYNKIVDAIYKPTDPDGTGGEGGTPMTTEDKVRLAIEGNIVEAHDERTKTKT